MAYMLSAVVGEIGNNSFDHNLGNWHDIMGLFFGYSIDGNAIKVVLAEQRTEDLKILKKVKPELKNDEETLQTAFYEKISGRAPERRGNGLKFARSSVEKSER